MEVLSHHANGRQQRGRKSDKHKGLTRGETCPHNQMVDMLAIW